MLKKFLTWYRPVQYKVPVCPKCIVEWDRDAGGLVRIGTAASLHIFPPPASGVNSVMGLIRWSGALAGMVNNPTLWSWESAESGAICLATGSQNIGTLVLTEVVTKTRHNVQYWVPWPGRFQRYQVHASQTFGGNQSIVHSLYFARHKHGDYVIFSCCLLMGGCPSI